MIPHNRPTLGKEEELAAIKVLKSKQLSSNGEVLKFEKIAQELDDYFDIKNLKVFYLPYRNFTKDGKLESSSIKRIAINIHKNFTSEITIPKDMKDVSMYHFLRICDGDKENGPIQVNFEPGPNKALS